jgi:septum formation protein
VAGRHGDSVIIGADTFVVLGEKLLGKPGSADKAREMLEEISGKTLSVITGFTIIDTADDKMVSEAVETMVFIKELSDQEIENYVATGEPIDKAGAFAIQGLGSVIVSRIEGDYFNVMGLPLFVVSENLKKFGINIL